MIRSVWDDAGYDASVLVEDQCLFDTAALLVTKLFLSGVDSRSALASTGQSRHAQTNVQAIAVALRNSRSSARVTGEQVISGGYLGSSTANECFSSLPIRAKFIGRPRK